MSDHQHNEHFMGRERWFGKKGTPTGTDWADEASLTVFRAISGNGVFGADGNDEALVLGTEDTPLITGMKFFMLHKILVTAASVATLYVLRVIYGSDTMANNETAGQYTDVCFIRESGVGRGAPIEIRVPLLTGGTDKVWIRAKNATDNATIDFVIGMHEHTGE